MFSTASQVRVVAGALTAEAVAARAAVVMPLSRAAAVFVPPPCHHDSFSPTLATGTAAVHESAALEAAVHEPAVHEAAVHEAVVHVKVALEAAVAAAARARGGGARGGGARGSDIHSDSFVFVDCNAQWSDHRMRSNSRPIFSRSAHDCVSSCLMKSEVMRDGSKPHTLLITHSGAGASRLRGIGWG
jgi:hypothetical protein